MNIPILIGPRVKNKHVAVIPAKDAVKGPCSECESEMWLGPRQVKLANESDGFCPLCFDCCRKLGLQNATAKPLGGPNDGNSYIYKNGSALLTGNKEN